MEERTLLKYRERNLPPLHLCEPIVSAPKPPAAVVEGFAMGTGVSLAAACEYVITTGARRHGRAFDACPKSPVAA